ncbi:hypothetical protein BS78_04G084200 [Paspalum vaginatum]|nr:hypothetical protein BS78_04G084200 [Paspalum vaginatum]
MQSPTPLLPPHACHSPLFCPPLPTAHSDQPVEHHGAWQPTGVRCLVRDTHEAAVVGACSARRGGRATFGLVRTRGARRGTRRAAGARPSGQIRSALAPVVRQPARAWWGTPQPARMRRSARKRLGSVAMGATRRGGWRGGRRGTCPRRPPVVPAAPGEGLARGGHRHGEQRHPVRDSREAQRETRKDRHGGRRHSSQRPNPPPPPPTQICGFSLGRFVHFH